MTPDSAFNEPVLQVQNLRVSYPSSNGTVTPLQDFSLEIGAREVVGLIGDAGSGKSTAALACIGIVRPPGRIDAGSIGFGGENLLSLSEDRLRQLRGRDIGVIVQNPRAALNPMLRIGRQIGNVYRAHSDASANAAKDHAIDMLRMVGINDPERRVSAYAHELSGGMAQRALIAMALSSKPRLLIADEPTSGLDVTIQAQFLDQMWKNVQSTGSAILLISQDLGVIANYCDRVVVLHDGRIVEDRKVTDFFNGPEHPYSRDVLSLQKAAAQGRARPARESDAQSRILLSVKALAKSFPIPNSEKVVQAVDAVDFEIAAGETLGLVGESGSGKTTVGRCLLRLEEPDHGQIHYRGEPINGTSASAMRAFRRKIQIVFQDPFDSLNPRWTIRRILAEPLDLHTDLSSRQKTARMTELLDMVGLDPDWLDQKPKGLGAGAMQRLNIARAIAVEPEFIVLDEPTSVLAPQAVTGLIALLGKLQSELGLSFLFISHDLTTVKTLCHRVAVMYLGQIVELGDVRQVFENPRHPYAKALLSAHLFPDPSDRRIEREVSADLKGEIPSPVDLPTGCYLAGRCPHAVERCRTQAQTLNQLDDGRQVRCWRVEELG